MENATIWLSEKNAIISHDIKLMLEAVSYEVVEQDQDGIMALLYKINTCHPFDLLITNIDLLLESSEYTFQILDFCNSMNVLVLTAEQESILHWFRHQYPHFHLLHKPFTRHQLLRSIREIRHSPNSFT